MKQILVVDDDANLRHVLRHKLEQEGYSVILAANGFEALAQVQNHPPDLILLDLLMPAMDGYEVLMRLRGDLNMTDIPVIVISALERGPAQKWSEAWGAVDFISKPFSLRKMVARVNSLLGRADPEEQGAGVSK
jgi:CheY-like chemotaxis protein